MYKFTKSRAPLALVLLAALVAASAAVAQKATEPNVHPMQLRRIDPISYFNTKQKLDALALAAEWGQANPDELSAIQPQLEQLTQAYPVMAIFDERSVKPDCRTRHTRRQPQLSYKPTNTAQPYSTDCEIAENSSH